MNGGTEKKKKKKGARKRGIELFLKESGRSATHAIVMLQ
jgi:hypothetical protein